ncbi:hypothetical protein SAMN05421877_1184 [Sphingobacterium lactis]|uniref:Uncharacterized protein n=1 Tax=Sphingobacterium lactis TaxID=797291 RepID=A0A1H6CQ16_9SPHI|nr:hypothetical protein SAMN05421877_1184 [Sphingobacterium lactis]
MIFNTLVQLIFQLFSTGQPVQTVDTIPIYHMDARRSENPFDANSTILLILNLQQHENYSKNHRENYHA